MIDSLPCQFPGESSDLSNPRAKLCTSPTWREKQEFKWSSDWSGVTVEGLYTILKCQCNWDYCSQQPQESQERQPLCSDLHVLSGEVVSDDLQRVQLFRELLEKTGLSSRASSFKQTHQPQKVQLCSFRWSSAFSCKLLSDNIRSWIISANI